MLTLSYWRAKPVMAVAAMGLVPMLPSTEVAPVLVMPALVSRQKSAAVPRLTTARTGLGGGGDGVGGDGDGGGSKGGGDDGDGGEGLGDGGGGLGNGGGGLGDGQGRLDGEGQLPDPQLEP